MNFYGGETVKLSRGLMIMDTGSIVALALGATSIASCALLYRWAKNAPEGYEDSEGFHLGETPAPAAALAPLDWSKPLEASDGTPLVLSPLDTTGPRMFGGNPDRNGHYWVRTPSGRDLCVLPDGQAGLILQTVRNRAACDVPPAGWACTRAAGHDGPCAGVPANSNVPPLSDDQRKVLLEMSEEIGHTAAVLQARTGLPHKRVVAARRELADMGLAILTELRGDWGESNQLAGRGYILTPEGADIQAHVLATTWAAA